MKLSAGLKLLLLIGLLVLAQTLHRNSLSSPAGLVRITVLQNQFISIHDNSTVTDYAYVAINRGSSIQIFFPINNNDGTYSFRNQGTFRYLQCPSQLGQRFRFRHFDGAGVASIKFKLTHVPMPNRPNIYRIACLSIQPQNQIMYMGRSGWEANSAVIAQDTVTDSTLWDLRQPA